MKNVTLYRTPEAACWMARYRVKVHDPHRGVVTRQRNISTLLPKSDAYKAAAQKIANDRRNDDVKKFWAAADGKQQEPFKLRDSTPTCGQIVDLYLEKSKVGYKRQVADVFLTVVAEGVGGWGDPADRDKAREIRLSQLTTKTMLAFRDQVARKAVSRKLGLRDRNEVSINTYMRQAKSVFARKTRLHYLGLTLPSSIRDWADVPALDEDHYEQKFVAFDPEEMKTADEASKQMLGLSRTYLEAGRRTKARLWKNAYACYWIMRRTGLRNIEVENLRWEWFAPREDGHFMVHVIKRAYWKGPKKSSGSVPVHRDLYNLLLELFGPARPGSDGFVLCGTLTDRKNGTHRALQQFTRRYLQRGSKNAYALRKQFATEIENRDDLTTAATLLRHGEGDTQTAKNHYVDGKVRLNRVEPL